MREGEDLRSLWNERIEEVRVARSTLVEAAMMYTDDEIDAYDLRVIANELEVAVNRCNILFQDVPEKQLDKFGLPKEVV
jgi:hypothetical protein